MTAHLSEATRQLESAAEAALHAPSVFNTQPWRWRITGDTLELYADPDRQLAATDPEGRLLLLSCGTALHHARTALAAAGWSSTVERLPEPARPELLARVHLGPAVPADPEAQRMAAAISRRRTDRRAFGDQPVTDETLTRLRRFVEFEGAYLHVVPGDQVPALAISTERAAGAQQDDPAYREELARWTSRPQGSGDGVPPTTAVEPALRRVPIRDFAPEGNAGLTAGAGVDKGAAYVIVFGLTDQRVDLLRGGEALSALLLLATAEGLATAPLSEAVEVAWSRYALTGLLAGIGEPYIAVRLGYPLDREPLPPQARRAAAETIEIERDPS
ncbi:NAD(P)H nitroreductase [Amorphoplanes nipponensis]|uniref:NAD(P)H nitroreductase n=1 Tax=Actinoplanes nipponensis TaxID=135950 RepID=A0A919JHQ3_9ACTN|nr:nitroreductase [Actinoplanes nipponensis]GIE50741.1 NAD(P)H nitroreductase [Actinoplanes nipponensis]